MEIPKLGIIFLSPLLPRQYLFTMESTLPHISDLPPDKDFHLFVCYIRENLHDVHTIVANLEGAGLRCCYHERDFTPGSSILTNMIDTIRRSRHMLVVLSEDFVNSPYAVHELNEALHIRISEGYSIIPIKIEPCQVPDAIKHITWIDAENDDVNDMHHKIIDALLKTDTSLELKNINNGQSLSFKLVPFAGCLSFKRYRLVLDYLDRQEIWRNRFKLSTQNLDTLEEVVTKSAFVRYQHVFNRFKFITFLVYILMLVVSMLVSSVFTTVAAAHGTQRYSAYSPKTISGWVLWISMTCMVPLLCCCADCLPCSQLTNGLRIKAWRRMMDELWVMNKRARKLKFVILYDLDRDVLRIMRYNFNPCMAYFIRRCERKEAMQKLKAEDETLKDYTVRLFDAFLKSNVDRLFHPEPGLERHKMTNGARCICIQVEESLDLDKL
ncbi:uncharacterized protein LOC128217280 [Mya arenaria]|uniref:uncharacterized protein LOC128217280 n=1 Tax=Mya arenaria TaxID=6604 RepID=UPI0022E91D81|nr:uncharacterized protein LOC128217280 [Mya arenaria]XP_052780274.1 uncharacterized protein LOC128217280 [Mya arenaria]XP_052780275.1 uncharacterized protein LOC128217280 [Mya arenaria]